MVAGQAPRSTFLSRRRRSLRQWAIVLGLAWSGVLGFLAAWLLEPLATRLGFRPSHRLAAAAAWALLWSIATHGWWFNAFYTAVASSLVGWYPWPRHGSWALMAGWGFWSLVIAGVLPQMRAWLRAPGEGPAATPLPAEDAGPAAELADGTDIGCDARGARVRVADREVNMGMLVTGATGAGKTNTLERIAESVLRRGLPLVIIDGKGSGALRRYLQGTAERTGRTLQVWTMTGPTHYNALRHGGPAEDRDKVVSTGAWTEPHYRKAAEAFLHKVSATLRAVGERVSLGSITKVLSVPALRKMAQQIPDPDRLEEVMSYLETIDESTRSAATGLRNRVLTMVDSEAGPWLEPADDGGPEVDLLAAVQHGGAVLFSLDSLRFPSVTAQVGALILQDLKTVAARQLALDDPGLCYVIVDEFNVFDGPQLLTLLNKCREAGFCTILATQDLSDVAAAGGQHFADQVLANTNVKLILRQDVASSTQRIAATVGTHRVWRSTHVADDGVPTGRTSMREVEEPVLSPSVLQHLGPYEAVLLRKVPKLAVERVRLRRAE